MIENNAFMLEGMKEKAKRQEEIKITIDLFKLGMDINKVVQKTGFYEIR